MRVLHLFEHAVLRPTEYAQRTLALLDGLRNQGVQTVHVAAPAPPGMGSIVPAGWQFYRTTTAPARTPPWLRGAAATLLLARRLREVARLTRPHLVHVHAAGLPGLAAWPVARLARLPLLVEADRRAPSARALPLFERVVMTRADGLVAASVEARAALRADGVRARRIAVLPSAADLPGAWRGSPGPPGLEGAPLLAYAGRLDVGDGIDLLLAALAIVRRKQPALRLLVAGGGQRLAELEARIAALGLRGHVVFAGELGGRRAADLLPRADITVFPTMPGAATPWTPSRHLLNAMAQGCTIVASDLACHVGLVVHGHNGMLFRAGSRTALAEALARLLDEPLRRGPLGRAAADTIAARRSWPVTAARYRKLYQSMLDEHGQRRPK